MWFNWTCPNQWQNWCGSNPLKLQKMDHMDDESGLARISPVHWGRVLHVQLHYFQTMCMCATWGCTTKLTKQKKIQASRLSKIPSQKKNHIRRDNKGNCLIFAGPDSPSPRHDFDEMTRWSQYLLKPPLVIYACFTIFQIKQMGREMFSVRTGGTLHTAAVAFG